MDWYVLYVDITRHQRKKQPRMCKKQRREEEKNWFRLVGSAVPLDQRIWIFECGGHTSPLFFARSTFLYRPHSPWHMWVWVDHRPLIVVNNDDSGQRKISPNKFRFASLSVCVCVAFAFRDFTISIFIKCLLPHERVRVKRSYICCRWSYSLSRWNPFSSRISISVMNEIWGERRWCKYKMDIGRLS